MQGLGRLAPGEACSSGGDVGGGQRRRGAGGPGMTGSVWRTAESRGRRCGGGNFIFEAAERMDQPAVSVISDPRPHITQPAVPHPRLSPMSILAVAIAAISSPRAGSPSPAPTPSPSPRPPPDSHVTRHNEHLAVLLPKRLWKVRLLS